MKQTEQHRAEKHLSDMQSGAIKWGQYTGEGCHGCDEGFVYFITIGQPITFVKIGFTAVNPYARMRALQTGCPFKMTMRGFVLANMGHESDLHSVLEFYQAEGEWFDYSPYVKTIVEKELTSEALCNV